MPIKYGEKIARVVGHLIEIMTKLLNYNRLLRQLSPYNLNVIYIPTSLSQQHNVPHRLDATILLCKLNMYLPIMYIMKYRLTPLPMKCNELYTADDPAF